MISRAGVVEGGGASAAGLRVQREGDGAALTLKQKRNFFETRQSSLPERVREPRQPLTRSISFEEAKRAFEAVNQKDSSTVVPRDEQSTGETTPTDLDPSELKTDSVFEPTEEDRLPPALDESKVVEGESSPIGGELEQSVDTGTRSSPVTTERPAPKGRSLAGGEWKGKKIGEHYLESEVVNYKDDGKTGLAHALWTYDMQGGTDAHHVKYLSDEDAKEYELRVVEQNGSPLFFWRGAPLDTSSMRRYTQVDSRSGDSRVIFVMAVDGSIYVANEGAEAKAGASENNAEQWRFNHSSFVRGKPVAAAGELWLKDGVLKGITDNSGHYRPGIAEMMQVLRHFQSAGVDISQVLIDLHVDADTVETVQASLLLQYGEALIVRQLLTPMDRKLDKMDTYTSNAKLASRLAKAAEALSKAKESTTIDLRPKAFDLLDKMKLTVKPLADELGEDEPKHLKSDLDPMATSLWDAAQAIEPIDANIVPEDAYGALDELNDELGELVNTDRDDRDFDKARQLADDAKDSLGATVRAVTPGNEIEQAVTDTKVFDRIRDALPAAREALRRIKNDTDPLRAAGLEAVLRTNRTEFATVVKSAAVEVDVSIDAVIQAVRDLVRTTSTESPAAPAIRMLDSLVPGAGKQVLEEHAEWGDEHNEAVEQLGAYFSDFDDKTSKLGVIAYDFAVDLLDDDRTKLVDKYLLALDQLLEDRANAEAPVADVESFVEMILLPGERANTDLEEKFVIYKTAALLAPQLIDPDRLDALELKLRQQSEESGDGDDDD